MDETNYRNYWSRLCFAYPENCWNNENYVIILRHGFVLFGARAPGSVISMRSPEFTFIVFTDKQYPHHIMLCALFLLSFDAGNNWCLMSSSPSSPNDFIIYVVFARFEMSPSLPRLNHSLDKTKQNKNRNYIELRVRNLFSILKVLQIATLYRTWTLSLTWTHPHPVVWPTVWRRRAGQLVPLPKVQ